VLDDEHAVAGVVRTGRRLKSNKGSNGSTSHLAGVSKLKILANKPRHPTATSPQIEFELPSRRGWALTSAMKNRWLRLCLLATFWLVAGCERGRHSNAEQGDAGVDSQSNEQINTILLHVVDDVTGERIKNIGVSSGVSPKGLKIDTPRTSHVRVSSEGEVLAVWIDSPEGGTSVAISAPGYEEIELRPDSEDIVKVGYWRGSDWSGESRELRMKRSEQAAGADH
jgi:hypothetical protein